MANLKYISQKHSPVISLEPLEVITSVGLKSSWQRSVVEEDGTEGYDGNTNDLLKYIN